jgi:hypothetical protein
MLEMKMFKLLQHQLIVEVLNLVYEGEYSVDRSTLSLSETFNSLIHMDIFELKSITERLLENINALGIVNEQK